MIDLYREQDVFVLSMNDGENRINARFVDGFSSALDEVERHRGSGSLVTTGSGKFYSNGFDLGWLGSECEDSPGFIRRVQRLFARLLTFPKPTIAAVNGHAFAAGAMLVLAHDSSVMRADRGYFCLPEIDLGTAFPPGLMALIRARLPQPVLHQACTTGRRYGAGDALAHGIIAEAAADGEVLTRAIGRAQELAAKSGETLTAIKRGLYAAALSTLEES
jgi:enoyl-CoA hydratase/carnithine racemase